MSVPAEQMAQGSEGQTQATGQEGQGQQVVIQPVGDSLVDGFLKSVKEEHRPILEPYIREWDKGVTQKFQQIRDQYKSYDELGVNDPEILAQALQIYQTLDSEPEKVYQVLKAEFENQQQQATGMQQGQQTNQQYQPNADDFGEVPPALLQRLDSQEQVITQLAQLVLGMNQKTQVQQEEEELDNYLEQLKQVNGDFDQDWVLTKIAQGYDPEDAVKAWGQLRDNILSSAGVSASTGQNQNGGGNQNQNQRGKVLSGGGSIPSNEPLDLGKMDRKDVRNLVADLVQQASAEGE